jgi:hypothetical protein
LPMPRIRAGFEQKSGKASSFIIAMTASGAAWR